MKALLYMIILLFSTNSLASEVYVADLEKILINIKDYKPIDNKLKLKRNKLEASLHNIKEELSKASFLKMKSSHILNKQGRLNLAKKIKNLEKKIYIQEQENANTLLELERSLKFPLIRKILYFIKKRYDQKKIPFIVDRESIFYYRKDHMTEVDLTLDIIKEINRIDLSKIVLD